MIRELSGSSFYFYKEMFDSVPISMSDVLNSEVEVVKCSLQPWCAIDEKYGVFDLVFLRKFLQETLGERGSSGWKELHMQKLIGCWIDNGVQPAVVIVELDHGLVECDVVRLATGSGL